MVNVYDPQFVQFDDLSRNHKRFFIRRIWNGVGSSEYAIDPPDSIFAGPSIYHDFHYWRGGDDQMRELVDEDFYIRCVEMVKLQPKLYQPFYYCLANVYYTGLKLLGKKAWTYREPCKTWEELLEVYKEYVARCGRVKRNRIHGWLRKGRTSHTP